MSLRSREGGHRLERLKNIKYENNITIQVSHISAVTGSGYLLKIGFVGLGTMGAPMAINLLKAGFGLKVFDIEPGSDRVKRVVEHGAKLTEKPRDVAKGSEFILLSLPNASASEQAMLGEEGILQATSPGSVVIELSTVSPSTVRKIANSAEPLGIDILDAPVSGGKSGAESATLTIM